MIKTVTLKNKLTVILNQNKSKHRTTAYIYIKAGSLDNKFKINGKVYNVNIGTAHTLEHYLIEQSIYGNIDELFSSDYISSNGLTTYNHTAYYLSTVHDFRKNFIKLLNIVNNPIFQEDRLTCVKKPIFEEIKRANDRPGKLSYDTLLDNIFQTKISNLTLGTAEDLDKINIEDLKYFHQAFYRPENQVITIAGNFDDNILELIESEYQKFDFPIINVMQKRKAEQPKVVSNYQIIKDKSIQDNYLEVGYKIDILSFSPMERNKLDYYFNYLFESNFSEQSDLFNNLFKAKKILYSIDTCFKPNIIQNMILLSFRFYTKDYDEVLKLLQHQIKNFTIEKKSLSRWKNDAIINRINMSENFESDVNALIDNMFVYNLAEVDTIEFIQKLNIGECRRLVEKIDFSNYTILINDVN